MHIKILNQSRDRLMAVKEIIVERKADGKYYFVARGIDDGSMVLGIYKTGLAAEKVMLNIVKRYNMNPELIMIMPEDDEDIITNRDVLSLPCQGYDE